MTIHANENPIANASSPVIVNQTLTVADFEYSYTFPTNTRKYSIKVQSPSTAIVKFTFTSGQSGTAYMSADVGGHWEDLVGLSNSTIYMQSATAGTVVEILTWS